jgi:GNAT superfamily N-acetyltransferase
MVHCTGSPDQVPSMLRCATPADIPRIVEIRGAVRENRLSDPSRVTAADVDWHIAHSPIHLWDKRGVIKGFSAGDPRDGSIFALFVDPAFEGHGIGQALILAAAVACSCGSSRREAEHGPGHQSGALLSAKRLACEGPRCARRDGFRKRVGSRRMISPRRYW